MALPLYLAMTAAEFQNTSPLPPKIAWMACHFSAYGLGLSNLPKALPADSVIIVDDSTPICEHDPAYICDQLHRCVTAQNACAVLLDLQRKEQGQAQRLAEKLSKDLPVQVVVSESYAAGLSCPVFLPPVPPDISCRDYLAPYRGREIWLEASFAPMTITVTTDGAKLRQGIEAVELPFHEDTLHCGYRISLREKAAVFHLQRSAEDLWALLEEAQSYGVTKAVGLFQELYAL